MTIRSCQRIESCHKTGMALNDQAKGAIDEGEAGMWSGIEWRLKRSLYDFQCRAVLKTPPCRAQQDGVVLFSMIGTQVM
ncbi:MAG: hypothetical protein B7Z20_12805, partial [Sphingobium sp. 32-64-5]